MPYGASVLQGSANLEKGFHRIEFWLASTATSSRRSRNAYFEVKVHPPTEWSAVPLTKDMMLLRTDQAASPQERQQGIPGARRIPYVDY